MSDLAASPHNDVEAITKAAGTSFYYGMRILPKPRRQAMYAIYAFCRVVDDIADEDGMTLADKTAALDWWRGRIGALYQGHAGDPITSALRPAVSAFALRREDFLAVIDGMAMDSAGPIVAPDLATLDLYCDRVASAVGRLSVRAFGDASAAADAVAHHLGRALQLTNILRDIAEDAALGRLYLPAEFLRDAGIAPDPATLRTSPALDAAARRLALIARAHFLDARAAMDRCDRRAMRPARLMGATYAAILTRLELQGWDKAAPRVELPKWQKLALAARAVLG
jgi:phytoene synthase